MAIKIDYYITMVSKNNELVNHNGSSLTFSAHGWWGKEKELAAAKISVRPRKNTAEGGFGGNSAVFLQKIEAKPAALLVQSRTQQKSFLFHLEEKIRRAQNQKCRENFFAGWQAVASGGGLVHFRFRFLDLCIRFGKIISKVCEDFNSGADYFGESDPVASNK